MKRQPFPPEPIPISQGHAFTKSRGKQPGFGYLQPTELDFAEISACPN
jgi:hypothetical protein